MKDNNFNVSNSGINITTTIGYDTDLSQIYFDENIVRSENFDDFWIYTNYGNLDCKLGYDSKKIDYEDLYSCNESQENLEKLCKFLENEFGADYNNILNYSINDLLGEFSYGMDLNEYDYFLECTGIYFKKHYKIISVSGYGQGDFADVIILTDVLKDIWGVNEIDINLLRVQISNYFYDSPAIVRVYINDIEYIDTLDGLYIEYGEYDKYDLIARILNEFKDLDKIILMDELDEIIPNELDY